MNITRQSPKRSTLISITLLAGVLLAGCTPTPAGPPPKTEHNTTGDLVPYENLVVKHAFGWEKDQLEIIDDTHLRISFTTGPPLACERFGATVVETKKSVTVTLLFGEIPNAEEICKDESKIYEMSSGVESISIETKSPIGNREIINGGAKK